MDKPSNIIITSFLLIAFTLIVAYIIVADWGPDNNNTSTLAGEDRTLILVIQPNTGEKWWDVDGLGLQNNRIRFKTKEGHWIYLSDYQVIKYPEEDRAEIELRYLAKDKK